MNIIRHGELLLKEVKLPKQAKLNKEIEKEIVAHSETGHHHILEIKEKTDMAKMKFYTWEGNSYVEVPQMAELWHQKVGKDNHKTHIVPPAVYQIILKKEFDYFAGAIKIVRD